MAPPSVYFIGTLVEVDSTKTGYIVEIDDSDDSDVIFTINYSVLNEIKTNVRSTRCKPVSLRRASTTRSGTVRQLPSQNNNSPPPDNDPPPLIPPPPPQNLGLRIGGRDGGRVLL